MMRRTLTLMLMALCLSGCGFKSSGNTLQIGVKSFAEQHILAEMLRRLAGEAGFEAEISACNSSFECHRSLREGDLDVMVEYSGTALQYVGGPQPNRSDPIAQVRRLYGPLGLKWLDPLGFDNSYCLLIPTAMGGGFRSIADLAALPDGLRLASPAGFHRRARDGLPGLLRRYGLRLEGDPLIIDDPIERYQALREGRIDVAVGYGTDGAIDGLGLTVLDDNLGYFPPYAAAVLIREDHVNHSPALERQLSKLSGELSTETMQELNSQAQVEGQSPEDIALRFLTSRGFISNDGSTRRGVRDAPVLIALDAQDNENSAESALAARAVRHLFPDRPVKRFSSTTLPLEAVATGRAHFAVVDASSFFPTTGRASWLGDVEAVTVLGTRVVHLLIKRGNEAKARPPHGRIGVPPAESSSGVIASTLLKSLGTSSTISGSTEALITALKRDEIDGAILVTEMGDPTIVRTLSDGGDSGDMNLSLASPAPWLSTKRAVEMPFLQRVRIPANTYPDQLNPVETLAVQVVLASSALHGIGTAGPAGPETTQLHRIAPLTLEQLEGLSHVTSILEIPDAALPSPWTSSGERSQIQDDSGTNILETLLNVFIIAFLIWLAFLVRAGRHEDDAMDSPPSS